MPSKLVPVDEALTHLLSKAVPRGASESVLISQACGRVLAETVVASIAVPGFDNSAMDGYAVNHEDCADVGTRLRVSQYVQAGMAGAPLQRGTAARIFTGAPLPLGATAVVMQENALRQGDEIQVQQVPHAGENVRRKGHDIAEGATVLHQGSRLRPQELGLLASLGLESVKVYRPLVVAVLNTGDELQQQGKPLGPGQLYDSNSYTVAALLEGLGMRVIKLGVVADSLAATEKALGEAAASADCVISTGGVSVGEADFVRTAVEKLGRLSLWKLAIKPGKPFSFGSINKVPFMGLPGNPVAVFITFHVLVMPFLLKMQGASSIACVRASVKAGFDVDEPGTRQEYLRVRVHRETNGECVASLFEDQSSNLLTSLSWADGLAVVPAGVRVSKGQWLEYLPLGA